mgnify:CR=1 FL=1
MRILANSVILLLMVLALSVSALAFWDITIHSPWVISDADAIPSPRLQAMRIGVVLTFSYYGLLHLIGKSQEFYPLNFLTTYLFYMLLSVLIIFYRRDVLMQEWGVLLFSGFCFLFCYLAGGWEASTSLKYKASKSYCTSSILRVS